MPTYSIKVQLKSLEALDPEDIAAHVKDAVKYWDPDSPFSPCQLAVKATCRGATCADDDFNFFLGRRR